MTRAIIVGSEGQDGRLLYDRLASDGWDVVGLGRNSVRSTSGNYSPVDISRCDEVARVISDGPLDALFYLAAVHGSSEQSENKSDAALFERSIAVNVQGVVNFLERLPKGTSLLYAASSHVFGKPESPIQDEATPLRPNSIYGITKAAGIHACRYYRDACKARASVGILYNHESPLRRREFITRRVAQSAVAISEGRLDELVVGNLHAAVDWGYAPDYVDAMLRIVMLDDADDFIVATGETHTVQELIEVAFSYLGLDWQRHVRVDNSRLHRESRTLVGNSERIRKRTGWAPTVPFSEMVQRLVDAERERAGN